MVAALATLAVPTATAQKINDAAFKAKLEKSNADIANPKKSGKAATWYNRGKICADAIAEPTKNLFAGLEVGMLAMSIGVPESEVKENIYVFDWVDVHTKDNKVIAWTVKKDILPNAFEIAKEAFLKAIGTGLTLSPDSFRVVLGENEAKIEQNFSKFSYYLQEFSLGESRVCLCATEKAEDLEIIKSTP